MIEDLERITKLWKSGALSDAEFEGQKQRLMDGPLSIAFETCYATYGPRAKGYY